MERSIRGRSRLAQEPHAQPTGAAFHRLRALGRQIAWSSQIANCVLESAEGRLLAHRVERDSGPICPKLRDKRTPIGCQIDAIDPFRTRTTLASGQWVAKQRGLPAD
jgi:hypothetical protein